MEGQFGFATPKLGPRGGPSLEDGTPLPVAADSYEDTPTRPLDEALAIAASYQHETGTRLGIVSRALLATTDGRRHGLIVDRSTWLEDTDRVQREVYELIPHGMAYVRDQIFAAVVELIELLQHLPWKSPRDGLPEGADVSMVIAAAQEELVDVLIFVGNLAVALGLKDDTIWAAVNEKASRNVSKRRGLGKETA